MRHYIYLANFASEAGNLKIYNTKNYLSLHATILMFVI